MIGKTKKILKEIEQEASKFNWPIVGVAKGKLLDKLVQEYKPKHILEIGTLVGYSAILMSQHLPKGGQIITIEINPDILPLARENFRKAGVKKKINIINDDAMKAIPKLPLEFDMVFIDANKDEYYNYILLAESKLSPNAIVVADNVKILEHDMKDYLDYVRYSKHYLSKTYDFGFDAMEVSFKQ